MEYLERKTIQLTQQVRSKLTDFLRCGLDPDGNRMYSVRLQFNQNTPQRQRYDRYCGLLGQVEDLKDVIKDMWYEFSRFKSGEQNDGKEDEEGFDELGVDD